MEKLVKNRELASERAEDLSFPCMAMRCDELISEARSLFRGDVGDVVLNCPDENTYTEQLKHVKIHLLYDIMGPINTKLDDGTSVDDGFCCQWLSAIR